MVWMMVGLVLAQPPVGEAVDARDTAGRGSVAQQRAASNAVVHEWGTFTSAHGPDGVAHPWRVLEPTHALPSFVNQGLRQGEVAYDGPAPCQGGEPVEVVGKADCRALIRMETPVIYVHVDAPARLHIAVTFVGGQHSEWYPAARYNTQNGGGHRLDWGWVTADPNDATLPPEEEGVPSPYYAARNVDAALLRVDGQVERFLFYRGVGGFQPTVSPAVHEGVVRWDGEGAERLLLFERRGDAVRIGVMEGEGRVSLHELVAADPRATLRAWLLSEGLFADEVEAMLATWEADWFEPGLRAFYLMPSAVVDETLQLRIEPRPKKVVRVIVARAELFTEADVLAARSLEHAQAAHGRFGDAVWTMAGHPPSPTSGPVGMD
jgi:hypothetical protein